MYHRGRLRHHAPVPIGEATGAHKSVSTLLNPVSCNAIGLKRMNYIFLWVCIYVCICTSVPVVAGRFYVASVRQPMGFFACTQAHYRQEG